MKHMIINIDIPVTEKFGDLTEHEAKEAAKQAYIAVRKSLPQWTAYNENDVTFKIES